MAARFPDPVMDVAVTTGLHPSHPLQQTYGHEIAAEHVAFANRVANSIRAYGGVTVPADPSAPLREVASGTPASNWFSVGGAVEHRSKEKYPELSTPLGEGELAPDDVTPETRMALTNIVRTQNENLGRQFTNQRNRELGVDPSAPGGAYPMLEVGGWSENGMAVHDVANVNTFRETPKGGQKRQAERGARSIASKRGERAYFDASTGESKDPATGLVLPD